MSSLDLQDMRRFDGTCIVVAEGEVDESTVEIFEARLAAGIASSHRVVVDLSGCTLSSDGLAALIRFHRRTRARDSLALVARDSNLLRMLEIVGLSARLTTYPTVNAALTSASRLDATPAGAAHPAVRKAAPGPTSDHHLPARGERVWSHSRLQAPSFG